MGREVGSSCVAAAKGYRFSRGICFLPARESCTTGSGSLQCARAWSIPSGELATP
jgi:hypothetical protein